MTEMIFFLTILILLYTYFGYPLLLSFLMKVRKNHAVRKRDIRPYVSIVVAAYNEEGSIGKKLNNILALDYPKEKMEVVVVSDASSDKTDEIVRGFAEEGVRLFRMKQRSGKIAAYRGVLSKLMGEIVVFSDATSRLDKESLRHLVSNFGDKSVGCVGGLLLYSNPQNAQIGEGESRYWEYEKRVKEYESNLCSLTSISGTFYAVRKGLFPYNIKNDLADDLIIPLEVKKQGLRTVLEPKAICREFTTLTMKEERAKRIRITIQNIRGLIDQIEILNPFRYKLYSLLVISHKLLRLLVPAFLLILLIVNLFLANSGWIYAAFLVAQVAFYLAGSFGHFLNKKIKLKIVSAVSYFCLSNLAILVGIVKFLGGEKIAIWEPVRIKA